MLLATILLLCPFPQIEGTAKTVTNAPPAISDSANDRATDSLSQPLPSAPEPKIKSDAELAAAEMIQPGYMPGAQPAKPISGVKMSISRPRETPTERRLWYALSITGSGAAAFDAWSTRRAISEGYGTEANPLLRPFSHSGAMYAATQVSPLLMDFIGKRMMVSEHKWIRSTWWLPQSIGTSVSLFAGVHNTRLVP
jgi:hypothetical protein